MDIGNVNINILENQKTQLLMYQLKKKVPIIMSYLFWEFYVVVI